MLKGENQFQFVPTPNLAGALASEFTALCTNPKAPGAGKGKRLVIGNGAEAEVNAGLVELIKDSRSETSSSQDRTTASRQ
jgi:hypothetical protein